MAASSAAYAAGLVASQFINCRNDNFIALISGSTIGLSHGLLQPIKQSSKVSFIKQLKNIKNIKFQNPKPINLSIIGLTTASATYYYYKECVDRGSFNDLFWKSSLLVFVASLPCGRIAGRHLGQLFRGYYRFMKK